jgi:hypothetical protein
MTLSLSAICTLEMSTLGGAPSSGLCVGGRGVPSRDDMAEEGVAGGGGEELEEGPEGYLNLGLELPVALPAALDPPAEVPLLLPESLRMAAEVELALFDPA